MQIEAKKQKDLKKNEQILEWPVLRSKKFSINVSVVTEKERTGRKNTEEMPQESSNSVKRYNNQQSKAIQGK